jgi:4-hydroxyacetophenone monooxygenase
LLEAASLVLAAAVVAATLRRPGGLVKASFDHAEVLEPGRLEAAVRVGNIPSLIAVLYQLTGERRWLSERYRPTRSRGMDDNDTGGLPEQVQAEIRDATVAAVRAWAEGRPPAVPAPTGGELVDLMSFCMGEEVPQEYEAMAAELAGFREVTPRVPVRRGKTDLDVVVIGAGVSGLLTSIKLTEAGIGHVVLEKNAEVGGSWWENRYPGAGVDTPSYLYAYSFFPRAWSTYFGKRDEVQQYLLDLVEAFNLRPRIRLRTEVVSAVYDEARQRWMVTAVDAEGQTQTLEAAAVVTAVGQLNRPKIPNIPGLNRFSGPLFHSACWPEGLDLTGKRVAVIGTGASAMQIVPAVAEQVAQLVVFQRSPQWVAPNADYFRPIEPGKTWLMQHVPYYLSWYRTRLSWNFNDKVHPTLQVDPEWAYPERAVSEVNDAHRRVFTEYLDEQLAGREDLRTKALPQYPPFGKRMLLDNGWFQALRRPNVELVDEAVVEVTEGDVRSTSGVSREVDVVVLATGFQATRVLHPMDIRGRSGRAIREVWRDDDASAYLGITVPDFPNLFLLSGPHTVLGHGGSYITIAEAQVRYIVDLLCTMIERDLGAVEVRQDVHDAYNDRVDSAHRQMVWSHPGMDSWYRNAAGRVVANLPWRIVDYWEMTRHAALDDYIVEHCRTSPRQARDREAAGMREAG